MTAASTSYVTSVSATTGVMLTAQATGATTLTMTSPQVGYLAGILIVKALTGTLTVAGFFKSDGTTAASLVLPAATPAGFVNFAFAQFATLTVTKSSASDDDLVMIVYRNSNTVAP